MSPSPDPTPRHAAAGDPDATHRRVADDLAGHALGEPLDPAAERHLAGCDECRDDLAAFRHIAGLTAGTAPADAPAVPPAAVWDRIAAQLAADADSGSTDAGSTDAAVAQAVPAPVPVAPVPLAAAGVRRPRTVRRATGWLAAAAAVVVAGLGGWAVGTHHGTAPAPTAQALLSAQPGTAAAAHGQASMQPSADGYQMQVSTTGLPAPAGYYEVWLYDPATTQMVAIGTLGADARGTFTVPAGIDTESYHVVDVSDQRYDGNPAHQTSVLRGPLQTG